MRALMVMRGLLVLLVSCAGVLDGRVVAQTRQGDPVTTAFRAGIEIVSVNVTVTSADQRFVGDLTPDDFIVLENGVPQPLRYFAKSGIPLSLALLIDTSASMADALPLVQNAAIGFVRQVFTGRFAMSSRTSTRLATSPPAAPTANGAASRYVSAAQARRLAREPATLHPRSSGSPLRLPARQSAPGCVVR